MVRIGVSLSSSLVAPEPRDAMEMMVGRAKVAYEAGLTALTVGDHHATAPGWYMQNTPTLGRLLAHWPDRPAGCLFLLPLWNPMLVAEHVSTLAAMVRAPFIVQVGLGTGPTQFAAFGADLRTRGRTTDEAIRVVQRLLAGETVESPLLGDRPIAIGLRPTQPVEWWIGGHVPASLRRAAELGTAWYGGPALSLSESERLIGEYRRACETAGSEPRAIARLDGLVLDDGDEARAAAGLLVDAGYRGMTLDQLLVGDADDAAARIAALGEVGYDDVMVRSMTNEQAQAEETFGLLGTITR